MAFKVTIGEKFEIDTDQEATLPALEKVIRAAKDLLRLRTDHFVSAYVLILSTVFLVGSAIYGIFVNNFDYFAKVAGFVAPWIALVIGKHLGGHDGA